jgi:hypothetical protein
MSENLNDLTRETVRWQFRACEEPVRKRYRSASQLRADLLDLQRRFALQPEGCQSVQVYGARRQRARGLQNFLGK